MSSPCLRQVWCTLGAVLLAFSAATPMPRPQPAGFLRLPMARSNSSIVRRQVVGVPLRNDISSYEVQLEIGTPSQSVTLDIDTGSSDIWTYGPGSCQKCVGGIYDPSQSSTGSYASDLGSFDIRYFDQSSDSGYYVRDNIQLGGTTVSSAVIAVTTETSDRSYGIMGIGLDALEAATTKYPGLLDDLQSQGIIETRAYSLYLDDLDAATGSLILGGIDSSKYVGDLVTLPIVASSDGNARLSVQWNSISITSSGGSTTSLPETYLPYPVVLDTGYTLSVLPNDLFSQLTAYFGAQQNANGVLKVNCDLGSGFVNFGFGAGDAVVISVPFSELAVNNILDSTGGCIFGFQAAGEQTVISFGDTFLRSAYVVYNYDAMTISLAQASYDQSCADCAGAL